MTRAAFELRRRFLYQCARASRAINHRVTGEDRTICASVFEKAMTTGDYSWVRRIDKVTSAGHCERSWYTWLFDLED